MAPGTFYLPTWDGRLPETALVTGPTPTAARCRCNWVTLEPRWSPQERR